MDRYHIILASNSPRRKELLAGLGLAFDVRVLQGIDESYPPTLPTRDIAEYISQKKAAAYREQLADDELVITADTIVVLGDEVMGKPVDEQDASHMLHKLSGKTHQVITGVTLTTKERQQSFSVLTDVTFKQLTITSSITVPWTRQEPTAFRNGLAILASQDSTAAISM